MADRDTSKRFPRLTLIRGGKGSGAGSPPTESLTSAEPPSCPNFHAEAHLLWGISGLSKIVVAHATNAETVDDSERLDTFCMALLALTDSLDDKLRRI